MSQRDVTDPEADSSSAFLTVMRQAAAARQNGSPEIEHQWLATAAQRHPLDDNTLDQLTMQCLAQTITRTRSNSSPLLRNSPPITPARTSV